MGGAGAWRFACAVTGGSLLAANASSPFLVIGSRRFILPGAGDAQGVPAPGREGPGVMDEKMRQEIALHRWAVIAEAANTRLTS